MHTNVIVEARKLIQRVLQTRRGRQRQLPQQRLQRAEQALDAPVLPWAAGRAALVADTEELEHSTPQPTGEHALVVGAYRFWPSVVTNNQAQVAEQGPRALVRHNRAPVNPQA